MANCKDCIHNDVCEARIVADENYPERHYTENNNCSNFKDRNKFIELPCKVGDTVYHIQSVFDDSSLKSKNVIKPRIIDFISTSSFLAESQGLIISEKDFDKTVFLTREKAEKALEEREK